MTDDYYDDQDYYQDEEYYDSLDYWIDACGQVVEGGIYQCLDAGTEECSFHCPFVKLIGTPAHQLPKSPNPNLNNDGFPF